MHLVVHGPPEPDEALFDYLQRLCGANAFNSVTEMLGLRVPSLTMLATESRVVPIAAALGMRAASLRRICFEHEPVWHGYSYRNRRYGILHIDHHPKVCPQCLDERAVHPAVWRVRYWLTCPRHGCRLVAVCTACGERLGLRRMYVDACRCGASLAGPGVGADEVDLRFARLLAHAHGLAPKPEATDPCRMLAHLEPHEIMSFARVFGRPDLGEKVAHRDEERSVSALVALLDDWPESVHRVFRRTDEAGLGGRPSFNTRSSRHLIHQFYSPRFEFLTREYVVHNVRTWACKAEGGGRIGFTIKAEDKPYLSTRQAAAVWGVSAQVVHRLVRLGLVPANTCTTGTGTAALISRKTVETSVVQSLREAARRPARVQERQKPWRPRKPFSDSIVSQSVARARLGYQARTDLGELVERGLLRSVDLGNKVGIVATSISALLGRLRKRAVQVDETACPLGSLSLRYGLRSVDILAGVLAGDVEVRRRGDGGGLDGYGVPEGEAHRLAEENWRRTGLVPAQEVARRLGASRGLVQMLVRTGVLSRRGEHRSLYVGEGGIEWASVEAFARDHMLGPEIAARLSADSRQKVSAQYCGHFLRRHGVERVDFGETGDPERTLFLIVRRRDVEHLLPPAATTGRGQQAT